MPLFQVDVEKQLGSEYWTNRYIVNSADLEGARSAGNIIVGYERAIHSNQVFFTQFRARTLAENDGIFVNVPIAQAGQKVPNSDRLPLFNVMRVDLTVGVGRPSRKFYRLPIYEGEQADGVFGATIVSQVSGVLTAMIQDLGENSTPLVDPQGTPVTNIAIYTPVGMRQLRRGSKRKQTPVL